MISTIKDKKTEALREETKVHNSSMAEQDFIPHWFVSKIRNELVSYRIAFSNFSASKTFKIMRLSCLLRLTLPNKVTNSKQKQCFKNISKWQIKCSLTSYVLWFHKHSFHFKSAAVER